MMVSHFPRLEAVDVECDSASIKHLENQIKDCLQDNPPLADSLSVVFLNCVSEKNDSLKAVGWYYRAESAYYSGKFDSSGDYYHKAIVLLYNIEAPEKKAIFYNNLGLTRYFKERYNEALKAFSESARYEQMVGNEYGFAECLHNIALVQDKAGNIEEAETYFKHSMDVFFEMDSLDAAAAVCNDYAIYLTDAGENAAAIELYQKALDFYAELNNPEGVAKVKCNVGALYLYEEDYVNAARYLDESLKFFQEHDDESFLINIYSLLGDLYYQQGRSALSVIFYERAENIANQMGWDNVRQKNLYSLFKALKEEQEYERALEILETYSHLKDSLIIANKAFLQETLDNEVESELIGKELKLARNKVREMSLVLIILGLIIAVGVTLWFLYGRTKILLHEKEKQLMQQKMMRIQMNPHFIFNALSSLQSYIVGDDRNEAVDYLSDIAFLMRKIMHYADVELIALEEEMEVLNKYLKVQCRRYYQTVDCGVSSEIISGSGYLNVPPMLPRPFVDDLFAKGKRRDCCCPGISITYEQKEKELEVTVENKGVVILDEEVSTTLEIMKERLTVLKKEFQSGRDEIEQIDIVNNGKIIGTRIRYWLPLIKELK
jgi:tetratricopeptide (TPR) repeat protein